MASKLKNIQAIRKMLDGTHHKQTKLSVGFSDIKPLAPERKIGDTWIETDANGVSYKCTKHEGFVSKEGLNFISADSIKKYTTLPSVCPKCSKEMKSNRYNKKMWLFHQMCFDCVIDMEHELKITGQYEEYEKQRITKNIESWLKDVEAEVAEIKKMLTEDTSYVNSDGSVEVWKAPYRDNKEMLYSMVDAEYESLKNMLLSYGNE